MTITSRVALVAATLLAFAATSASASTVLRTDPGNALLTGTTTLTSTSSDGFHLQAPGVGALDCAQSTFDLDVAANASTTTIAGVMTAFTGQSCTDTFGAVTFTSCHLHSAPVVHVGVNASSNGELRMTDAVLRCGITATGACYFTSSVATGIYSNATSTLAFEDVPYSIVGPTADALGSLCGFGGTWSATFTHVVQGGTNLTLTVRPS